MLKLPISLDSLGFDDENNIIDTIQRDGDIRAVKNEEVKYS